MFFRNKRNPVFFRFTKPGAIFPFRPGFSRFTKKLETISVELDGHSKKLDGHSKKLEMILLPIGVSSLRRFLRTGDDISHSGDGIGHSGDGISHSGDS